MKQILETYTSYNLWANTRIVDALKENQSVLGQEMKSSFTSIRKTVFHIWGCEELWWKRLHRESMSHVPNMDFKGSFPEAAANWLIYSKNFCDLVQRRDEKYFTGLCEYSDTRGNPYTHPRWWMVHHCMNHSTFHRGQIVTMMRGAGLTKIPATDLILYLRDTAK